MLSTFGFLGKSCSKCQLFGPVLYLLFLNNFSPQNNCLHTFSFFCRWIVFRNESIDTGHIDSTEFFIRYSKKCLSHCHKISKWYDEPMLSYRRVKICNFAMSKQRPRGQWVNQLVLLAHPCCSRCLQVNNHFKNLVLTCWTDSCRNAVVMRLVTVDSSSSLQRSLGLGY